MLPWHDKRSFRNRRDESPVKSDQDPDRKRIDVDIDSLMENESIDVCCLLLTAFGYCDAPLQPLRPAPKRLNTVAACRWKSATQHHKVMSAHDIQEQIQRQN